jgi:hypothetical protein
MKKLVLNVDDLHVESFSSVPEELRPRGTVLGRSDWYTVNYQACYTGFVCSGRTERSCGGTCYNNETCDDITCFGSTCYQSCVSCSCGYETCGCTYVGPCTGYYGPCTGDCF